MHTFFQMKNVIPCDKDVNENYLKHTQSLHLFRHKIKLMWLGDELGQRISKRFDIHRPNSRRRWKLGDEPSIVPTKFITGDKSGRWSSSPRWEPSFKCQRRKWFCWRIVQVCLIILWSLRLKCQPFGKSNSSSSSSSSLSSLSQ